MIKVEKLLTNKDGELWTLGPDNTVLEAIQLMDEKNIGSVAVVKDDQLIGIFTERDYTRKLILKGRSSMDTPLKEVMTRRVHYARPEQDVEQCMAMMTEYRIRHLPVMQDDKLIGMISIGDVVKDIIAEQKYMIEHLEQTLSWEENY